MASNEKESRDRGNFDIGYISKNVVLDPDNQQTRFYNLQAESTLSSLDSNLDPYLSKDPYLSAVSPHTPKELISKTDDKVTENIFIPPRHTDGVEGDDEYEEDVEEQKDRANVDSKKEERAKNIEQLQLNLNLSEGPINQTQEQLNEIIFSPGGNEVYVFAPSSSAHSNVLNISQGQASSLQQSSEKPKNLVPTYPRGERPTTVGQSDDSPKKNTLLQQNTVSIQKAFAPNRSPRISTSLMRHKQSLLLAQASTTDDTDNLYSTEHSTDPSPRRLPELPYTREQLPYLNRDIAIPYQDVLPSASEKDDEDTTGKINHILYKLGSYCIKGIPQCYNLSYILINIEYF